MRQAGQLVDHDEGADRLRPVMPGTRRSKISGVSITVLKESLFTTVSPNHALPARRWSGAAHDGGEHLIGELHVDLAVWQQRRGG